MYCPIERSSLRRIQLDAGLPAFECSGCTGHWVRFGDYLGWRERQPSEFAEVPTPEGVQAHRAPEPSGKGARLCPDCQHFLSRYRVGRGVRFTVDQCGHCNGMWLDAGEWETLRGRGLHDNLHEVFGPGWQYAARTEEQRLATEEQFQRQLGDDDFGRTREFGRWLAEHPRRSEVLAYLQWVSR